MAALATTTEAETIQGSVEHIAFITSQFRHRLRRELRELKAFTHWRQKADEAADAALTDIEAVLFDAIVDACSVEARAADLDVRKLLTGAK